jgi:fatty acid desaturase
MHSTAIFLFLVFATLSWIRSGICFRKKPFVQRLATEIALGSAVALLAVGAVPGLTPEWALGVLMFFLIQALYFVLLEPDLDPLLKIEADPFEKAKTAAENILDSAEK